MDIIMAVGSIFFFFLFGILLFNFALFLFSLFKKKELKKVFKPNVSIVIPCYNEEKNIKLCVESLMKCGYDKKQIELILIDDGSTDSTVSFMEKLQEKYFIKIIKQNHEGKVEALNKGIKAASNDLIITLDADTIVSKHFIENIVNPFLNEKVGATSGAVRVKNHDNVLTMFQNLEYHQNNLIRNYFSQIFNHGIWFFGSLSCYRKKALQAAGYFKKDTVAEDMDIAMEISAKGYLTINVADAIGHTIVPNKLKALFEQRSRWWIGGLQSLRKNKEMLSPKSSFAIKYLFFNQYWWSFYAIVSIPIILYQIWFWLPSGTLWEIFAYFFRWFTLMGPIYVLYMIPKWGINVYNIFGVLSGIISCIMLGFSIKLYKDKINFRNIAGLFFYFPYTILLNIIIVFSLVRKKEGYFIK